MQTSQRASNGQGVSLAYAPATKTYTVFCHGTPVATLVDPSDEAIDYFCRGLAIGTAASVGAPPLRRQAG